MDDEKIKKFCKNMHKCNMQCLPVVSATLAALLTEDMTVREIECLALFVNSLSQDLFYIAAGCNKNRNFIIEQNIF